MIVRLEKNTLNRTMMELKYRIHLLTPRHQDTLNRTMMELKLNFSLGSSSKMKTLNRTMMELKFGGYLTWLANGGPLIVP